MVMRRVPDRSKKGKVSEDPLAAEVESGEALMEALIAYVSVVDRRLGTLESRVSRLESVSRQRGGGEPAT